MSKGPIFVAASNGSGTRLYAQILADAGVYQGEAMNYASEPEAILPYTRSITPKVLHEARSAIYAPDDISGALRERATAWMVEFSDELQQTMPTSHQRWGWKHPRNLYLLPLLDSVFPDCVFVHVIRDGRDMAIAGNQADFRALGGHLGYRWRRSATSAARFWSSVNCDIAEWCESHLGERYIATRFEDLCASPDTEISRLIEAAGLDCSQGAIAKMAERVSPPDSIGRWQTLPGWRRAAIAKAAKPGLTRFGYR